MMRPITKGSDTKNQMMAAHCAVAADVNGPRTIVRAMAPTIGTSARVHSGFHSMPRKPCIGTR
jgi:hypothetical protein